VSRYFGAKEQIAVGKKKRFSLPLSPEMHRRFKVFCVRSDVVMADFLSKILERELDRHERQHEAKAAKPARNEARAA
jgi:ParG